MRYSSQVKPISYPKASAAEVLARLSEQREPMVITQNGEARAVLQHVVTHEENQETLALLKVLALGSQDVEAGRVKPVVDGRRDMQSVLARRLLGAGAAPSRGIVRGRGPRRTAA